jgi:hypothetical protein
MRRIAPAIAALALALVAAPLAAYTVYLKDGSKILAKEKYRVDGDKAIITLVNGTDSFLQLSEIDVPRTEEANQNDYGTAVVLEGVTPPKTPPPAAENDKSLSELIQERGTAMRELPEARREEPTADEAGLPRTPGGWIDLTGFPRQPYSEDNVAGELKTFLHSQGLDSAKVFQGTAPGRPFLEIPAGSEAGVFRALAVCANALLHARDLFGERVKALELLMLTPNQERGGQFLLTPEEAADLAARRVEVAAYFLHSVEF